MQVRCYWIPGTVDLPTDLTAVPATCMRILDTGEADKEVYSWRKQMKGASLGCSESTEKNRADKYSCCRQQGSFLLEV